MEGSDFLLAGVLFLFAAVAAVPLASRLGMALCWDICWQGLQLARGGWGLLATSMRSSTFRNSAWCS